jgi:probable HAF family extracellular repeat protein
LGGGFSTARGINDSGVIVGMSGDAFAAPTSFIYRKTMQALPGGPSYSSALAINNGGQVVGSGEGTYGYLVVDGQYTRLDTLPAVVAKGWRHLEPTGINDRGWIVGTGTNANGDLRAFLLIPGSGNGGNDDGGDDNRGNGGNGNGGKGNGGNGNGGKDGDGKEDRAKPRRS